MLASVIAAAAFAATNVTLSGYICPTCPSAVDPAKLLSTLPKAYNIVNIAFVGWNADGSIVNQFDYKPKNFTLTKATVAALQAEGRKVLISIGGGAGGIISGTEPAGFADKMSSGLVAYCKEYGFDGVDFDIEHRSGDLTKCAAIVHDVMQGLKTKMPSLKISMAPQMTNLDPNVGLVSAGFNELAPLVATSLDLIDWIQPQMYNSWAGVETLDYAKKYVAGLQKGYKVAGFTVPPIPASKLVLGYPASPKGAGSGYIAPCKVVAMLKELSPPITGLMTWSIGWDEQAGWKFADCVAAN